eukprot:CAMPEP_0184492720 /NCGR_PEP_ID=MMETSP0113_2-20130426/24082_1 /TAXON_ID=91329 /ORGANISM="Norrisiella sphaerica, Strain BC52" /LENGTH=433 /DNA_ID=CAMNT_0026877675 /DNA_START=396 /DNA_END=1697 /DNA_ORIENTATION=+
MGSIFTTVLVWNMLFARALLNESLGFYRISGAGLIITGVCFVIAGAPRNADLAFTPKECVQLIFRPAATALLLTFLIVQSFNSACIYWFECKYPLKISKELAPPSPSAIILGVLKRHPNPFKSSSDPKKLVPNGNGSIIPNIPGCIEEGDARDTKLEISNNVTQEISDVISISVTGTVGGARDCSDSPVPRKFEESQRDSRREPSRSDIQLSSPNFQSKLMWDYKKASEIKVKDKCAVSCSANEKAFRTVGRELKSEENLEIRMPSQLLGNLMRVIYPVSLGIHTGMCHIMMKTAVSMFLNCEGDECSHWMLGVTTVLWCVASVLTLLWLKIVYARYQTICALPIQFGTVNVIAVLNGFVIFEEHKYMEPWQVGVVIVGLFTILAGIEMGRREVTKCNQCHTMIQEIPKLDEPALSKEETSSQVGQKKLSRKR